MIVLDLPAEQQAIIEEKSQKERMTVEQYIIHKILGSILSEKEKPFQNNVKKLKGIIKTDIHLTIDEMNQAIAQAGANSAK